jgi:hypothetical protein
MTEPAETPPDGKPAKLPLKQRLSALFAEYGRIAVIVYFSLSILAIIGFSIAFGVGWEPTSATGVLGVIFAGWVAAKATLPIRILITLALTPMVSLAIDRWRARRGYPERTRNTSSASADDSGPPAVE